MGAREVNVVGILRDKVDRLEARLDALGSSLATCGHVETPAGLSPQQYEIIRYLRRKSPAWVSRNAIERFLWGLREDTGADSAVRLQIMKIRASGAPIDIESRTGPYGGYRMTRDSALAWDRFLTS